MGQTGCTNVEYTGSQPPATISGGVTCAGSTVNGWCTGSAQLSLSSNEPVAGYNITLVEGTRNGVSFACPAGATSCNVDLLEGTNDFTFWALSSWGDSSLMSTATGSVDTQSPTLTGSLSGMGGDNGWYVSNVTLSASASDPTPGSGVDSFTYTLDGGATVAFPGSLTLTDGVHTILLQTADVAGHVATSTRSISVDTVAPSSAFTYTPPASGWVRGSLTLTGTSSDATSGLAQVELSTDGGLTWQPLTGTTDWSSLWDTITVSDGTHLVLARAQDVAGNPESTASLSLNVDNTPPQATLDAPASFCPSCGTASLTYAVDDVSSGLASWNLSVDGTSLASGVTSVMDTLTWDGGGLSLGSHTLALTVVDLAGNITDVTSPINLEAAPPVEPPAEKPSFLWFLATKTPTSLPTATQAASTPTATRTQIVETFGVVPPEISVEETALPETGLPDPQAILWGAAAAGVIAAATAYALEEKRKREEEEARQRAEAEQQNADARAREKGYESYVDMLEQQAQAAFDAQWNEILAQQAYLHWLYTGENPPPGYADLTADERLELYKQTQQYAEYQAGLEAWNEQQNQENKNYQLWVRTGENPPPGYEDASEEERLNLYKLTQEFQNYQTNMIEFEHQKELSELAYLNWLRTGENPPFGYEDITEGERLALYQQTEQYKNYQSRINSYQQQSNANSDNKFINWLDEHQVALSIGVGLAIGLGVAAILLSGGAATPLVAAAWIAGGALLAGGVTVGGTVLLNSYYDRPWDENIIRNGIVSAGIAVVTVGLVYFLFGGGFTAAVIKTGNSVAALCATRPALCTNAGIVLDAMDKIEEVSLMAQMVVQTAMGNDVAAAQTSIELQMEYMDGGVPGNSLVVQSRQILEELGEEAVELVEKHGDDIVPLFLKYGDDAIDIIRSYGDEGIELLLKNGDDAVRLFRAYGDDGVELLFKHGDEVIDALDGKVVNVAIEDAEQFANDIADMTGAKVWVSTSTGAVYASRSSDEAIEAAEKLVEVGPNSRQAVEYVDKIVEESTRGDGNVVILGRYGDNGEYIQNAVDTNGTFLNVGPEVEQILADEGIDFWVINERFLRQQLESKVDRIDFVSGDISEIRQKYPNSYAAREIRWLEDNAYKYGYTLVDNSWIRITP